MQESFQEKRRAEALKARPTWALRAVAGLVVIGVCVAVFLALDRGRSKGQDISKATPSPLPQASGSPAPPGYAPNDPKADQLESLLFTQFTASGKKGVELEAKGSSGREAERRFLDTVKAKVPFVSQGKAAMVEIIADHAQHVASRPSALFQGHVKMTTDDGLVLETDELFYDGRDGFAQSERKVVWKRKDISGEAMGMLYEGWSDSITFFKDVKIKLRDPDDAPADIDANSACLSRTANTMFLDGDVRIVQGGNRTKSGSLELFFGENRQIYRAVFRDGFELVTEGDTAGLGFSFPRTSGRKIIRGRRLDMTFGEGRVLEEVAAGPEAVMIVEPGPQDPPERREIRADALVFKFGPGGKLKEYLGNDHTSVRFLPLGGVAAEARSIAADYFVAYLDPATGTADSIVFNDNVIFERKGQRGKGAKAEFSEQTARMIVSGGVSFDDSINKVGLLSQSIDLDTRTGSFRAWGGVRHTQRGGLAQSPFGGSGTDLLATSRQVLYDAAKKTTQYLDRVVLRSGEDVMRAGTIETTETPQGSKINADTDVEIVVAGASADSGIDARSTKMVYSPQERTFDFTGSAVVKQKDFDTRAPQILVALGAASGFEVKRLEAQGGPVSIKAKDRTANATHLLYTPQDGKVVLEGAPVKLEDNGRRVQGKSITFFTSGDQVEVVGEEGRTETVLQRKIKKP